MRTEKEIEQKIKTIETLMQKEQGLGNLFYASKLSALRWVLEEDK